MSRKSYSQEMQEVKDDILLLGSMVEDVVMESVQALKDNDLVRSRHILDRDLVINRKRYEIETSIIILMATQQPIAHELRMDRRAVLEWLLTPKLLSELS